MKGCKRYTRSHERLERCRLLIPVRMEASIRILANAQGWRITYFRHPPLRSAEKIAVDTSKYEIELERTLP